MGTWTSPPDGNLDVVVVLTVWNVLVVVLVWLT